MKKKIEINNVTIALKVLYAKKVKIYPAYVSKHNSYCDKQIIILMIPNRNGWNCFTVKNLSALLRRTTSKHHGGFFLFELPSFL